MKWIFLFLLTLLFPCLTLWFLFPLISPPSESVGIYNQIPISKNSFIQFLKEQPSKTISKQTACSLFSNRIALLRRSFEDLSWLDTSTASQLSYKIENLYLDAFLEFHEDRIKRSPIPAEQKRYLKQKMALEAHARIRFVDSQNMAQYIIEKKVLDYDTWNQSILYDSEWQWFRYDELDAVLARRLFNLQVGESTSFLHAKHGWVTIETLSFRSRFAPNQSLPDDFDERIKTVYYEQELERWVQSLVRRNSIQWNKKELKKLWK